MPRKVIIDCDPGIDDALALTLEADGTGALYPVVYLRRGGRVEERVIEPDPLLRFDTLAMRTRVEEIVEEARGAAAVR